MALLLPIDTVLKDPITRGRAGRQKALSADDLDFAEAMLVKGLSQSDIAARLGVCRLTLAKALKQAQAD